MDELTNVECDAVGKTSVKTLAVTASRGGPGGRFGGKGPFPGPLAPPCLPLDTSMSAGSSAAALEAAGPVQSSTGLVSTLLPVDPLAAMAMPSDVLNPAPE